MSNICGAGELTYPNPWGDYSCSPPTLAHIQELKIDTSPGEEPVRIPFKNQSQRRRSLEICERIRDESSDDAARPIRATMPDRTRQVFNAVFDQADTSSDSSLANTSAKSPRLSLLTVNKFSQQLPNVSPKFSRRYSQAQDNAEDIHDQDGSSVDREAIGEIFQTSAKVLNISPASQRRLQRRRSSPDLTNLPVILSAPDTTTTTSATTYGAGVQPILPEGSILAKMVGSGKPNSFLSSLTQRGSETSLSTMSIPPPPPPTSLSNPEKSEQSASAASQNPPVSVATGAGGPSVDSVDSRSSGFGFFTKTRQFGAWLTSTADREKMDVTKKDVNVFAPTTF